ncbi:class I SAM-dependent methyltransferase [Vibrio aestuarianus]|uniref:class I SAM-dependent methyltransferase n=1 Tax=Vibrio aestuarianus TaxID=28171 RepID=UPI00237CB80B|nr:class I SAM-dependent methyltransferase [Vibrio aestuarianus]MDE1330494.1 class I SAM-dependent methyltransferase [Vibrio aestuarianus]
MSEWDSVADQVNFNLRISACDFVAAVPFESKVLDFGCGYGRITKEISGLGYHKVVGIDSSKEMVNRGLSECPELDLRHLSTEILPFSDDEFDSIILCAVLTCIPDQSSRNNVLRELHRVLKPQGIIYLAEFCSDQSLRFVSGTGVSMWHSSKVELEGGLKDFYIESSRLVDNPTMSGHESKASHIIARKVI